MSDPFGTYTYHALQTQMQKAPLRGPHYARELHWSKTLTNADSE